MNVAGDDPLDLRVGGDQLAQGEPVGLRQPDLVEHAHPDQERRVVHGDQGGGGPVARELGLEPGQALRTEGAGVLAGDGRVAGDQSKRAERLRVLQRLALVAGSAEVGAHAVGVVVVADQHVERNRELGEQLGSALVLRRRRVLGDVAGQQHRVGQRVERVDGLDRGRQRLGRAGVARADRDVGVG